jgi:hypothetical protein
VVAIAVLGTVMAAAMIYVVTSWRYSQLNRDKVFAYEKAVSILTDMQAFLETSAVEAASDLDSFEDGGTVKTSLSIARDVVDPTLFVAPDHPASGNNRNLGSWRWSRQISVRPFPGVNSRDLRIVTVRIFRAEDGVDPVDTATAGTRYAEVSSVLRTIADAYPTTQVYDVYLLALENVPGWWVFMDAIKPFIETTIDDLQARNPGLRFRTHWITKLGYGRDPFYRSYWNVTTDSNQAIPFVHFYPGMMPPLVTGVISSSHYYVPEALRGWARNESGEMNGFDDRLTVPDAGGNPVANGAYNPFPYTLADNFNHCTGSVDAEAWFRLRRDIGGQVPRSLGAETDEEPTMHILMDRMKSSPSLYANAIFINLHGELIPMPPMRGYSDPAKDPRPAILGPVSTSSFYSMDSDPTTWSGGHPGVRVATHTSQKRFLRAATPATSEDVTLRVYAWKDDPEPISGADILSDPIEVQIYGVNLSQRIEQPTGWIDLGVPWGFWTQDRSTWTSAWFKNAWGQNPVLGNGLLRVEACKGGVDCEPLLTPDGIRDPYLWYTPYVLGLGEYSLNNSFPFWLSWFPYYTVTSPAPLAPPYRVSQTFRPEGFFCGYPVWNDPNVWVYNGGNPVVRAGWVPPEMDPEGVGYTLLRLYNTPLRAPMVGTQGLRGLETGNASGNYRLYGREYVPTTCEAANDFAQDLTYAVSSNVEKNTARWRITIRRDALNLPIKVRNARTGAWVDLTAADPEHPADANDSDHWPLTVTTRIGSRVQDYDNDGRVDPTNPADVEEHYIHNGWNPWNSVPTCFTVMETVDRAMHNGATRPDPAPVAAVGPTAYTYTGGLRVRVPDGLERPVNSGSRQSLSGGWGSYATLHRPENLQTSYAWWTDRLEDVPASEQAQFLGDPRHVPFRDFKNVAGVNYPNAYNWYFDNFRSLADGNQAARWPGFDAARIRNTAGDTSDGWMGRTEVDVPRLFKTLRESLAQANMLWTTLTGFSYYYLGLGNEIGYDSANGYANSIPVNGMPFGQAAGTTGYEQSITSGGPGGTWGSGVKFVRSNNSSRWLRDAAGANRSYWWGANWIGEQYPDDMYGVWARDGNLPAGSAAAAFRRVSRTAIQRNAANVATQPVSLPYGTNFGDFTPQRRTQEEGCTSLFNIGASNSTFHHTYQSSTENGGLTTGVGSGTELANSYSFPLPTRTKISRPFNLNLNGDGTAPTEFSFAEFVASRFQAFTAMRLYDHDNGQIGSGLIVNRDPTDATGQRTAFVLVNGIDRASESGSAFISRYSMVSLIHSFLIAGFQNAAAGITAANRIRQLPRVQILTPTIITELTNPATVPVTWHVEWKRWDGLPYTGQYAGAFAENEADLRYVPMWSNDNGATWFSMMDNTKPAVPGQRPSDPAMVVGDAGVGMDETATWTTDAATFPRGSYLIRVDCYRGTNWLHYAYHQEKVYILR